MNFWIFFRKLLRDIHWKGTLSIENRWASQVNLNVCLLLATVRRGLTILRRSVRVTCSLKAIYKVRSSGMVRIKIFREIPTGDTSRKRTTENGLGWVPLVCLYGSGLGVGEHFSETDRKSWCYWYPTHSELTWVMKGEVARNYACTKFHEQNPRKNYTFTGLFIKMNWLCDLSQEKHWFRIPSWVTSGACFMYISV